MDYISFKVRINLLPPEERGKEGLPMGRLNQYHEVANLRNINLHSLTLGLEQHTQSSVRQLGMLLIYFSKGLETVGIFLHMGTHPLLQLFPGPQIGPQITSTRHKLEPKYLHQKLPPR